MCLMLASLINIIFPRTCALCNGYIGIKSIAICHKCQNKIDFIPGNHPLQKLWFSRLESRFPLNWYRCLFDLNQNNTGKELISHLKYSNLPQIGLYLGEQLGHCLSITRRNDFDAIIPVPLHPNKLRKRGYNQSEKIALGIAKICNKPVLNKAVKRLKNTSSQTKKDRWQRITSVENVFGKGHEEIPEKILLVDDVLTTGNTIENVIKVLPKQTIIQVATLGIA